MLHAWPEYAAYAVSFVTIGIMWINHHTCMQQIGVVDRTFLTINLVLLMCIAFVPFPTNLIAENVHGSGLRAAALTYGVTLTVTSIFYNAFWFYAARGHRLLKPDCDPRLIAGISRAYVPGAPIYAVATLVALVSPIASVASSRHRLFYLLESSIFTRSPPLRLELLERRPGEQAEPECRDDRHEPVDEDSRDDVGVGPPKPTRSRQPDLDDPDPAGGDRQRAEQARDRPGGERLDQVHLGGLNAADPDRGEQHQRTR